MLLLEYQSDVLNETQRQLYIANQEKIKAEERCKKLEEMLAMAYLQIFSNSSEKVKTEDLSEMLLFSQPSSTDKEETERIEKELIKVESYTRNKRGRKGLPKDILTIENVYDISDEEKVCPCGCGMICIGFDSIEKLHYMPAKLWKEVIKCLKYACPNCKGDERNEAGKVIVNAVAPPQFYPRSYLTPSLFAYIIVSKYVYHLPLYRIEKILRTYNLNISRAILSSWVIEIYKLYKHLFSFLLELLKSGLLIGCDETTLQVLNEPNRTAQQKSYLWVLRGGTPTKPVILFQYKDTRSAEFLTELLHDFKGTIQSDAFSSYDAHFRLTNLLAGCMDHARRKFVDVWKSSKNQLAGNVLLLMKKLYEVEREIKKENLYQLEKYDKIVEIRQQKSKPVMDEIFILLKKYENDLLLSPAMKKAIHYSINNWEKLTLYLSHGHIYISNIKVENAIRPLAVGRKNWLFAGSPEGAEASAFWFSLIETIRANNKDPSIILKKLFKKLPYCKNAEEAKELFIKLLGWT
jgi:transposase